MMFTITTPLALWLVSTTLYIDCLASSVRCLHGWSIGTNKMNFKSFPLQKGLMFDLLFNLMIYIY